MIRKILGLLCLAPSVFAAMNDSQASVDLSSQGLSKLVEGSATILQGQSELTLVAIRTVGNFSYLTLKAAGQSTRVILRVPSHVAGHMLVGSGQLVKVIATGTGSIISASGQLLAFLPNEMGKSLIYSNQL